MSEKLKVGLAVCGSYCTFDKVIPAAEELAGSCDLTVLMSENAYGTDTRFGRAEDFVRVFEDISGKIVLHTIAEAERVGPEAMFDVLAVAPCTGNTLGKLANGITDGCVTMAVKSHLRNEKPVVLGISTNDGLSGSAGSIAALLNRRHYYFVPFGQDAPEAKPRSLASDFTKLAPAVFSAARGEQLQPILA